MNSILSSAASNIARYLPIMAGSAPDRAAVIASKRRGSRLVYESRSFVQLEALSNRYANGLRAAGFGRGQRVLIMVRQGFDFVALVFALFKLGAVPVLIDPGMGVGRLLDCIRTVDLHGFIGIPLAQAVRVLRRGPLRTLERAVTVGRRWFWGGPTLGDLARRAPDRLELERTASTEAAAILFTSGSTGPAKGVVYEHGMFDAQVRMIQSIYGIKQGEIDLPTFPLFALLSIAMGMTIVLPDMDPSHPARVNPANVVDAILDQQVTNTFGSPALWKRVSAYCIERSIRLPTLRRVLIAGASVPPAVIEQLHQVLAPESDVHTPYGATESLPVSTICGREILGHRRVDPVGSVPLDAGESCREVNGPSPAKIDSGTMAATLSGAGTCIGRPVAGAEVRIIRITDDALPDWSGDLLLPPGEIGEICVRGPAVTREYFNLQRSTALAKIKDGKTVWHRIGDVGYFDEGALLWFCGRKAQRVQTDAGPLFTECIEPVLSRHPAVSRCALVGVGPPGRQTPVLIVELRSGRLPHGRVAGELAREILDFSRVPSAQPQSAPIAKRPEWDQRHAEVPVQIDEISCPTHAQSIAGRQWALFGDQLSKLESICSPHSQPPSKNNGGFLPVLFHRRLPVDIRHNAKINRELLAGWAAHKLAGRAEWRS